MKNGKLWKCGEGIDEPDEFDDPESNEYGIYYQTKTELFGTSRHELITAARWDYHDLLAEGVQFAPKIGFIYKPDEKSSFRFTYGKAFNTITIIVDEYLRNWEEIQTWIIGLGKPFGFKEYEKRKEIGVDTTGSLFILTGSKNPSLRYLRLFYKIQIILDY